MILIMLAKGDETDKLKSFDVGIDDHDQAVLAAELVACIRLCSSRQRGGGQLTFGRMVLDTQSHRLRSRT